MDKVYAVRQVSNKMYLSVNGFDEPEIYFTDVSWAEFFNTIEEAVSFVKLNCIIGEYDIVPFVQSEAVDRIVLGN